MNPRSLLVVCLCCLCVHLSNNSIYYSKTRRPWRSEKIIFFSLSCIWLCHTYFDRLSMCFYAIASSKRWYPILYFVDLHTHYVVIMFEKRPDKMGKKILWWTNVPCNGPYTFFWTAAELNILMNCAIFSSISDWCVKTIQNEYTVKQSVALFSNIRLRSDKCGLPQTQINPGNDRAKFFGQ